ncbi:hypothetical protein L207DRAFT_586664 [Hyaloscypha variabilis F]|uniref:Uncharacterized protein n=1 Tax=Hyaloscypha variabilis (strain UAMH 11265 / GT02V1 / F) TaxID=1149755 RepID=A0A2J6REN4_HYAVF|nr:hypothetical protein L207DRAFT_586664 [Hyaloscypha variabilis F]
MDLAREQIFGSLDRQKEIQAQFDVLKGELLTSISNLQCLNLADVHRIVVAFYDEALEKHIAACEDRKKLDLELLGSDAGLDEDVEALEVACREKAEKQWNINIKKRVEKKGDADFLEFCQKQRVAVNEILTSSAKFLRALDGIINEGVCKERSLESETGSSHREPTEKSEPKLDQHHSDQLQRELDIAKAENTGLTESLAAQLSRVVEQAKQISKLQSENLTLNERLCLEEEEYKKTKERALAAEGRLDIQAPLVENARASRLRAIELSKVVYVGKTPHYPSAGARPDWEAVHDGNSAVHHGAFDADRALYLLGDLSPNQVLQAENAYGKSLKFPIASMRVKSMANYRATMMWCGSFSCATVDSALDKEFLAAFQRVNEINADFHVTHPNNERSVVDSMARSSEVQELVNKGRIIARKIVKKYCELRKQPQITA